ncbi:unnamed protein product [Durusdinium trenchii]|uniref:Uncharacterized protein n=1 Tax=Durusdinium trenchii TaxID=1381693 RepID=A0ABP0PSF1_9DINO
MPPAYPPGRPGPGPGYPPRPSYGYPYYPPAPVAVAAPQYFTPKKWRVARNNTVVRKTEKLESEEVQKLQEGEIVEQVAPAFTTENGIVRVQIRHPSSPLFPKPIGWVTQDASAAGGPTFLEPGPEPMKMQGAAPAAPGAPGWRPSPWRPRVPPPRPFGRPSSFQNISWTPG